MDDVAISGRIGLRKTTEVGARDVEQGAERVVIGNHLFGVLSCRRLIGDGFFHPSGRCEHQR